ncbi:MAG: hypothetical protein KDC36_11205 [Thermoleophilia bacterium]|nr:hypothetical protein [Thermoleophilia bacterium]
MSKRAIALVSIAVGVIALIAGVLAISQRSTTYTAQASVIVQPAANLSTGDKIGAIDTISRGIVAETLAEAFASDTNVRQAFANGGLTTADASQVSVSTSVIAGTSKILITGSSGDPGLAERAADAVAASKPDLSGFTDPFTPTVQGIAQGTAIASGPAGGLLMMMTLVVAAGLALLSYAGLQRLDRVGALDIFANLLPRGGAGEAPASEAPRARLARPNRPSTPATPAPGPRAVDSDDAEQLASKRRQRANPRRNGGAQGDNTFDVELDPMPARSPQRGGVRPRPQPVARDAAQDGAGRSLRVAAGATGAAVGVHAAERAAESRSGQDSGPSRDESVAEAPVDERPAPEAVTPEAETVTIAAETDTAPRAPEAQADEATLVAEEPVAADTSAPVEEPVAEEPAPSEESVSEEPVAAESTDAEVPEAADATEAEASDDEGEATEDAPAAEAEAEGEHDPEADAADVSDEDSDDADEAEPVGAGAGSADSAARRVRKKSRKPLGR